MLTSTCVSNCVSNCSTDSGYVRIHIQWRFSTGERAGCGSVDGHGPAGCAGVVC